MATTRLTIPGLDTPQPQTTTDPITSGDEYRRRPMPLLPGDRIILQGFIPGIPVPKERPRVVRAQNGKTRTYTPEKTAAWESTIRMYILSALKGREKPMLLLPEPVFLDLLFLLPRPASTPKKIKYPSKGGKDGDNYAKAFADACEGLVFQNDGQVVDWLPQKRFAGPQGPGVIYTVIAME